MRAVSFEEAGRDGHAKLGGELLHRQHRLVLADRLRIGEQALVLDAAEIFALEQLGRQDDLGTFRGGLADQLGDMGDVRVDIARKRRAEARRR